jgi:CRP-like cAMP-binding protein
LNALQHLQTINILEHFQNARHVVSVPAGQAIFHEGEKGTVMYVLLEGMVDVSIGGLMVELAQPGTLLGEMALVDGSERSATAIARTDCRLVSIDARQFDLLVQETPAFARHVMRAMAERLRRMNERLREAFRELTVH